MRGSQALIGAFSSSHLQFLTLIALLLPPGGGGGAVWIVPLTDLDQEALDTMTPDVATNGELRLELGNRM